jgi:hypothetical protein
MRASHLRMRKCSDFSSKPTLLFLVKMDHPGPPDIGFRIFFRVSDPKPPHRARQTRCRGPRARQPPPDVEIREFWQNARNGFGRNSTTRNGRIPDFVFFPGWWPPSPYVERDKPGAGRPTRASHLRMLKSSFSSKRPKRFLAKLDHLQRRDTGFRIFSGVEATQALRGAR